MTRGRRDVGIDLVRALALLSMFVAHTAPTGGPGDLLSLSEFLTAPLFATLVGAGAELSSRRGPDAWVAALERGLALILLGILIDPAGAQVVVILVYLGVLTWIMCGLAHLCSTAVVGIAVVAFVVSPLLMHRLQTPWIHLVIGGSSVKARLVELLFTGSSYRISALTVWACVGLLLARHVLGRDRAWGWGAGLIAVALGALGGLDRTLHLVDVVPYSGSHVELLVDGMLAAGVVLLVCSLADTRLARGAGILSTLGRMSLSVYAAHVLWLAFVVRVLHPGGSDDSWLVLATLVVGSMALALAWSSTRAVRWGRGPVEGVIDRLVEVSTTRRSASPEAPSDSSAA